MTTPPSERLHPAAIAVWSLGQVGGIAFLWLIGPLRPVTAGVLAVLVLTASVVRYSRFRWRVAGGALVIEQGLFQRQRRVIPLERIQGVDLVRTLRHRLFGVVEVRAEAIGGAETEGRLDALSPAAAASVRELLLQASPATEEEPAASPRSEVLARVPPGKLVIAGLTGGRVGVMAALLGFAQQLFPRDFVEVLERLPGLFGLRGLLGVAFVLLVVAFVLSVAATVVTQWGFTLTAEPDVLRVRRGLLEQRAETLPLRRIQAVRVEENLVRRALGLAAVKVDVAGRAGGDERRESGLLLPLGRRSTAFALAAQVLDRPELAAVELRPAPPGARDRRLVRAVAFTIVVTAVSAVLWWPAGLLAVLVAVPAGAAALGAYRSLGHARAGELTVVRFGLLVRRTAFVPDSRVHSLALVASPFQRHRGLATLELQIPRSPGTWSGPQAVDVDVHTGMRMLQDVLPAGLP
jgi:putative membrane protein